MITEDYVSFEIAKLLKEKGFDEPCIAYWFYMINAKPIFNDNMPRQFYNNKSDTIEIIGCPTLQMAMKWLREVHKLYINIWADPKDVENNDFDIIFRAQVYNGTSNYGTYKFSTYEEAAETEIKYCLENLI